MAGLALRFNRILTLAPFLIWLPALLLGFWALFQAYTLRWTADDAFISFRYARAAAAGHGLTFNPGERVEGYTNFLWTVLLIPVEFLKLRTEYAAWAMGLASFCGLLAVCYAQMKKDAVWPGFFAALCLLEHLQIFATSGLETPLFALLITAGLILVGRHLWTADTNRGFILLALASLTRPDGLLVYAAAAVYCALSKQSVSARQWVGLQVRSHLPAALLLIPVWTAKSVYYGSILPNTFYAKSAKEPFTSQGLAYLELFAGSYWLLSGLTLLALVLPASWRGARGLYAAAIAAWLPYVAYVGGDFMFARFLVPILPSACLLLQEVTSEFLRHTVLRALLYTSVAFSLVLRPDPFRTSPFVGDISEEHRIYTRQARKVLEETALDLRPGLLASGVRVGFVGAQAAFLYYWYPLFGIESETGLTDRTIAMQTLERRGKIGHEKQASLEYLASRDVHILMRPPPPGSRPRALLRMRGIPGEMTVVRFDSAVFARLREEGAVEIRPDSGF